MFNKLYKKLLVIAGFAILATSCSKDFLEVTPYGKSNADGFYSTEEELSLGLYAAYSMLNADQLQGWSSPFFMKNLPSDDSNTGGGGASDQPQYQAIDNFDWQPGNQGFKAYYSIYYYGVYRCNQLINNAKISTDAAKLMLAQAKFLRAYYFFELTTAFGAVPLRLTNAEGLNSSKERTPQKDVYAQIAKDLNEAIPVLKDKKDLAAADKFRASKQTAQALLGKMYLYAGDYANAKTALEAVIATEGTQVGLTPNFADILRKGAEFNEESLLEASFVSEGKTWGNVTWDRNAQDNRHLQLWGPRDFNDSYNLLGYGLQGGWGFNTPTRKLFNSLDPNDPRTKATVYDFTASYKLISDSLQAKLASNAATFNKTLEAYLTSADKLEYKKDVILAKMRKEPLKNGLGIDAAVVTKALAKGPGTDEYNSMMAAAVQSELGFSYNVNGWKQEGVLRIKYGNFKDETTDAGGVNVELNYGTNWRLIRYADVLLMAAEANFKLNNTGLALEQLNKVRKRAKATLLTAITFEDIVKERQIELAFEGSRFFDLVRWGKAETELKDLGFKKDKHEHFPIPLDEMNSNTLIGSQNPGY